MKNIYLSRDEQSYLLRDWLRQKGVPQAAPALHPHGQMKLLWKLHYSSGGPGDLHITDWLCEGPATEAITINEQVARWAEGLARDIERWPGPCVYKGADGKYYTIGHAVGAQEPPARFIRQEVESHIRFAWEKGQYAQVKAMRAHLATLGARGRVAGEEADLRPAVRPFSFTGTELAALAALRDAGYGGAWDARTHGGAMASARAKMARAWPASDELVIEWVCGAKAKCDKPVKAGEFAKCVLDWLPDDWMQEALRTCVAEDGGFYSLWLDADVVEACPRYALALVEVEMRLAREEGDDARVAALKPHLEALNALAESEKQASDDEVAVVTTA